MKDTLAPPEPVVSAPINAVGVPAFVVELEPAYRVFFRNLGDLVWPRQGRSLNLSSPPGEFWPDVFVASLLPWGKFAQSVVFHSALIVALWAIGNFWPRPAILARPVFKPADVIYYSASEYLAPLNTGVKRLAVARKGDPAYSPQPILSVPPAPDNHTQTIVTPPDIQLKHDVAMPNVVAWSNMPEMPLAATQRPANELRIPSLTASVIAPPPEAAQREARRSESLQETVVGPAPDVRASLVQRIPNLPGPTIAAPPATMEPNSARRVGDMNMGQTQVVAPAPQLPVAEQRTFASGGVALGGGAPAVAAPPPSAQGLSSSQGGGRLIALSANPMPPGTAVQAPAGNRRGTFAATPQGKPGAAGTPDVAGAEKSGAAAGSGAHDAPPGLYVGAGTSGGSASAGGEKSDGVGTDPVAHASEKPVLRADATPPRVTSAPRANEVSSGRATDLEKRVFGEKKFYSMTLNMPNLNSAGGSWVVRFAELAENPEKGDLAAPVVTQKVSPAYPLELMKRNVQGTVALYAVIRSDGTVENVRVLQGVDDRLDEFARAALLRWHFQPATKNGNAVALEAVVMIPFRPMRMKF